MDRSLFLLITCILAYASLILCESSPEDTTESSTSDSLHGSVVGFKPCLSEDCEENSVFELPSVDDGELQEDSELLGDDPNMHCVMLRPSAVKAFSDVELKYPEISQIKYKVLEQILAYASAHSILNIEECSAELSLLDLVILSATSLKQDYLELLSAVECKYTQSDASDVIQDQFSKRSAYISDSWKEPVPCAQSQTTAEPCYEVTPEYHESTEKPCPEQSTPECQPTHSTERPCDGEHSTTAKPCPPVTTPKYDHSGITAAPCITSTDQHHEPCLDSDETEEIIAEDGGYEEYYSDESVVKFGSVRGTPGVHFPNYSDVPLTSFSCADKKIPGFYADLETGCQVFHVCYEHRRESFLCPVGTIFNQPILACDYWYSSNCSLAPLYYESCEQPESPVEKVIPVDVATAIPEYVPEEKDLEQIVKFLPVKAKVTELPGVPVKEFPKQEEVDGVASDIFDKIVVTATDLVSKTKDVVAKIPEPQPMKPKVIKVQPILIKAPLSKAAIAVGKAKLAAAVPVAAKVAAVKAAVPVIAKIKAAAVPIAVTKAKVAAAIPAAKVAAVKAKGAVVAKAKFAAAVPVAAKVKVAAAIPAAKIAAAIPAAKVAAVKTVIPIAKASAAIPVAAKAKLAVPKVAAKATIPVLKAKMIASALPLATAKLAGPALKAASVPVLKAKALALPVAKSSIAGSAPLLKTKLAKAAVISPLTKKALALGYMKLLKTKKFALMG